MIPKRLGTYRLGNARKAPRERQFSGGRRYVVVVVRRRENMRSVPRQPRRRGRLLRLGWRLTPVSLFLITHRDAIMRFAQDLLGL